MELRGTYDAQHLAANSNTDARNFHRGIEACLSAFPVQWNIKLDVFLRMIFSRSSTALHSLDVTLACGLLRTRSDRNFWLV
ncbi:hypothetical protein E2C01_049519 [Portunus trituberculatus]|uniref:Uncharacterized protein n=1 Tax=Portunus trituberculatus TaxID=210409 RepID=A0A5B7GE37_PORTR|nr:hypothetical protein [Portunus trituberculatus]